MESLKTMMNISKYCSKIVHEAVIQNFKDYISPNFQAKVTWSTTDSADLTTPAPMQIYNMCNKKPNFPYTSAKEVGDKIKESIKDDIHIIGEININVSQPPQKESKKETKKENEGKKKKEKKIPTNTYLDIILNNEWIENESNTILSKGIKVDTEYTNRKVLADFSSPNIAKEMHVGHLRSTILGDTICRILEYLDNDVMRINHVGDWGTQFGMLIAYLEFINPDYTTDPEKNGNIRDLEEFYKNAKKKFDAEPEFKKKAQLRTVELQQGDENTRKAWQFICQISRDNFNEIYRRLDIKLEEVGESFYDPICRKLLPELEEKKLIEEDQGCKVFRIEGEDKPLICVKSDGGIGYDTTDLAAINYRFNDLKRDWIIYVVGSEQDQHLRSVFKAAQKCGWHKPPQTRVDHMAFGLVTGKDGKKISTRKGGNFKLVDLLNESWEDAKKEMIKRNEKNNSGMSEEYINTASEQLGYSAVKYYDLKQFRTTNYKFDPEKMLDERGNTAVYLFYSYVRICSVYRKNEINDEELKKLISTEKIKISDKYERNLVLQVLKFNDVIEDLLKDLAINLLCDYIYAIAGKFAEFYEHCKITGNNSRLLITEITRMFMKQSFDLLGMKPIEKI